MRRQKPVVRHAPRRPVLDVSKFIGEWIAFHPKTHKIVGHGASPDEVMDSGPRLKGVEAVLYFVSKSDAFFVGPGA
jgi:hypothetical protein